RRLQGLQPAGRERHHRPHRSAQACGLESVTEARMPRDESFHWLDVEVIGEMLARHHPTRDPLAMRFVGLKALVAALPGFQEKPGHPVNERILEQIQQCWLEERSDLHDDESD